MKVYLKKHVPGQETREAALVENLEKFLASHNQNDWRLATEDEIKFEFPPAAIDEAVVQGYKVVPFTDPDPK